MSESHYLLDILILLISAVVAVPLFQRLGLGSILGYLAAGALVGPSALGFIDQTYEIRHIAEFGVVFLLFLIGIEMRPARLWRMRRLVFGLGSAQVLLTGLILSGLALAFGAAAKTAIIAGFGLALSSTAFGLQVMAEKGELETERGQAALSVLLLQDLAVVPLLALVSLLAVQTPLLEGLELAMLEALLVIGVVIIFGRFLLTPLLRLVALSHSSEVFTASAVLAVLGTAWLMEIAGLSMALGAFLAGLMLADSPYRHQVVADIQPFRGILLGLFFMGIGMTIDFTLVADHSLMVAGLVSGLMLLKALILWLLCRLSRIGANDARRISLLLSQSGEFGFVLFGLAFSSGLMDNWLFQLLNLTIALTMAASPLVSRLSLPPADRATTGADFGAAENQRGHVIIAGFGRVGRKVATMLEHAEVSYLGLDRNPGLVANARAEGRQVFFGDASRQDVLRAAGLAEARAIVIAFDQSSRTEATVRLIRQHFPQIPVFTRAHDREHCLRLRNVGADTTISDTLEASLQLGAAVLTASGISSEEQSEVMSAMREDYYSRLKANDRPAGPGPGQT